MSLVTGLLAALFPPRCEKVAELVVGRRALVRGRVIPRDFIDSTLTGERCVYYRYSVDDWRTSHVAGLANEGHWAMVRSDEAIVEFYLQDEDGNHVIIAPQHARVRQSAQVSPKAIDMGIVGQRAQELVICTGDIIEVTGHVAVVEDLYKQDRDYRANATIPMLHATKSDPLLIKIIEKEAN